MKSLVHAPMRFLGEQRRGENQEEINFYTEKKDTYSRANSSAERNETRDILLLVIGRQIVSRKAKSILSSWIVSFLELALSGCFLRMG
jgi:hypothetical protein